MARGDAVQRAVANVAAASTDSVLVAAVAGTNQVGKAIRVHAVIASSGAVATAITFNSKGSGAGTAISPTFQNGINGGEVLAHCASGWFETNPGEALTVTTGAGSTTGILVLYSLV